MNMYVVIVFNLEWKRCLVCTCGGKIPCVSGAVIKDICLTVYRRYSRPAWTRSCAACSRWPCFGRGVGLHDPERSLPTPNILWLYC